MYAIGITGPSGAGKTTALRVLEVMGGQVFDCDAIYHRLLASDRELLARIEAAFPGTVKHGALDRKALGARVFADPAGLQRLTDITQPYVARVVLDSIAGGRSLSASAAEVPCQHDPCRDEQCLSLHETNPTQSPCYGTGRSESSVPLSPVSFPFAVIDAIGLFESGLGAQCDLTVAVVADPEIRVRRLMARDGITEEYARSRVSAQKPASWFAERADLVLENNGDQVSFAQTCQRMFEQYLLELSESI